MKKTLYFIFLVFFISSCGHAPEKTVTGTLDSTVIGLNDFYANPDKYLGSEITLKGMVTHVCKHGGQKLFIAASEDGETLRIEVGENIPEFSIDMEGSEAEFTGVILLMDEEFIAQARAEHEDHHAGEEEDGENGIHAVKDKNYHLIAKSFRQL